jgi:hypothetical protein
VPGSYFREIPRAILRQLQWGLTPEIEKPRRRVRKLKAGEMVMRRAARSSAVATEALTSAEAVVSFSEVVTVPSPNRHRHGRRSS